jgi:hypothetical protein
MKRRIKPSSMENITSSLKNRLETRKLANVLFEPGKLPKFSDDQDLMSELYLRHITESPVDGIYGYIRYLARISCPGCTPEFKISGHDDGCLMDDGYAIDKYLPQVFKNLGLPEKKINNLIKAKYNSNLHEMVNAEGVGENDPLFESKRLAQALLVDGTVGGITQYLLHLKGREFKEDDFKDIRDAINKSVILLADEGALLKSVDRGE